MRKKLAGLTVLAAMLLTVTAWAKPAPFPGIFRNARYVYVTSFDGSQWNPNILPEDRAAIGEVEDAIRSWGHFTVVQEPRDAEMILVVQRRGSEDELAVFDPAPLFQEFRQAFESSLPAEKAKK